MTLCDRCRQDTASPRTEKPGRYICDQCKLGFTVVTPRQRDDDRIIKTSGIILGFALMFLGGFLVVITEDYLMGCTFSALGFVVVIGALWIAQSGEKKKELKQFEKELLYSFKKKDLLFRALTHKSYANEREMESRENNERYEYLGDAVLELAISHILIETFPDQPEGELSKLRAAIVNETQLAGVAKNIGLGKFMNIGKGEEMTGGREKPSLLSDAYEAVLGAIYLDRGFDRAKKVVKKHFKDILKNAGSEDFYKDYKTRLQEVSQSVFKMIPKYKMVRESGPDHKKTFEVSLFIGENIYGKGKGKSKKRAEQNAAKAALDKIEGKK